MQINGRGFRQHNLHDEIFERRYVTNSSFDAYSWQLVEFKSKYIAQIISATSSARVAEDLESSTLTYETCKAASSNNPKLLDLANIKQEVQKLQVMERAFKNQAMHGLDREERAKRNLENVSRAYKRLDAEINSNLNPKNSTLILGDKEYTDNLKAIERLGELMSGIDTTVIGAIYGMPLMLNVTVMNGTLNRRITLGQDFKYEISWKKYPKLMFESIILSKDSIVAERDNMKDNIEHFEKEIASLKGKFDKGFEHAEKLKDLMLAQKELENELMKESSL